MIAVIKDALISVEGGMEYERRTRKKEMMEMLAEGRNGLVRMPDGCGWSEMDREENLGY